MATTEPASANGSTRSKGSDDKGIPQLANELWALTVDYAKQEVRDPLKHLGSYVVWGGLAWLLLGLGCLMLSIGSLRALQTETGSTFTGNWSWAPYAIVLAAAGAVLGVATLILTKRKK